MNKKLKIFLSSLLLLLLFLAFPIKADINFPKPTNYKYVNDYVGIVNESDTKSIVSIGKELENKTGAQATIVIIDSTNGVPIEDYSVKLFRSWGIGQSGKDNGLLILLAINDRTWRVEVGRGLEGAIPDALSNRVMESLAKPNFQNNDYGAGLRDSYSTFSDYIAKEYNVTLEKSLNIQVPDEANTSSNFGGGYIVIILLALFFLDMFFNRGRVSSILINLLFWSNINNRHHRGGGGGGFGGFGGGSSNGGGSSGNW